MALPPLRGLPSSPPAALLDQVTSYRSSPLTTSAPFPFAPTDSNNLQNTSYDLHGLYAIQPTCVIPVQRTFRIPNPLLSSASALAAIREQPKPYITFQHESTQVSLTKLRPELAVIAIQSQTCKIWLEAIRTISKPVQLASNDRTYSLWKSHCPLTDLDLCVKQFKKPKQPDFHQLKNIEQIRRSQQLLNIQHPHLAQVYAVIETEDDLLVIGEWIEGKDLYDFIMQDVQFDRLLGWPIEDHERLVAKIIKSLLQGLLALHQHGLLHRDIKPENMMVQLEGKRKFLLLDYDSIKEGASLPAAFKEHMSQLIDQVQRRINANTVTLSLLPSMEEQASLRALQVHSPCGTHDFLAPEWFLANMNGCIYSQQSDIYAVGRTAYEMLYGQPDRLTEPFLLNLLREAPTSFPKEWSAPACDFIGRSMHLLPNLRFASVDEMLQHPFLQVDETDLAQELEALLKPSE